MNIVQCVRAPWFSELLWDQTINHRREWVIFFKYTLACNAKAFSSSYGKQEGFPVDWWLVEFYVFHINWSFGVSGDHEMTRCVCVCVCVCWFYFYFSVSLSSHIRRKNQHKTKYQFVNRRPSLKKWRKMSGDLGKGVSYPTSNLSKISEDTSVDRVGSVTSVQIDIDRRKSSIGPLKRELNFTELWGKHYWRQFTSVTPGESDTRSIYLGSVQCSSLPIGRCIWVNREKGPKTRTFSPNRRIVIIATHINMCSILRRENMNHFINLFPRTHAHSKVDV